MKVRRVDYSPDEFLVGTSMLTCEEKGAYWVVCSLIYSAGKPVVDDDAWIAKVAGLDPRVWKRIRARLVALEKLTVTGGKLSNGRCDDELNKAQNRTIKARENGAKGGRPPKPNGATSPPHLPHISPTSSPDLAPISSTSQPDPTDKSDHESSKINVVTKPGGFAVEKLTINHQPSTINQEKDSPNGESRPSSVERPKRQRAKSTTPPIDLTEALEEWNAMAHEIGAQRVDNLHAERQRHLRARLAECGGIEGWAVALAKIRESAFLRGEVEPRPGRKRFKCTIEFVTSVTGFTKIMEGYYDDRNGPHDDDDRMRRDIVAGMGAALGAGRAGPDVADEQVAGGSGGGEVATGTSELR